MKRPLIGIVIAMLCLGLVSCAGPRSVTTQEPLKQQLLVDKARITLENLLGDEDLRMFREYGKKALGLYIVPELYKGAWFFGGSGGRGVLFVRDMDTGKWIGPAFCDLGSVSVGLQFGGQRSEVIMLVMTRKGIESLFSTTIKLGGDASVAMGPVGKGLQGATAPSLEVDYISYARNMGVFLGMSLDGAVIRENYKWNRAYYGKPVRPLDILIVKKVANPHSNEIRTALSKAFPLNQ
ncbi:MAG: lipid-binding SYLF domain-containing protein [Deltaproteobacteria bacterium]|nr:lipid-binding SYLF domain-containing protein [Deltaproteobacteria bacterium]